MASGGSRAGSGRKPGQKNKATIEREVNAAAAIDAARRTGVELAKDVLRRLMGVAEGAAGLHKPRTKAEVAAMKASGMTDAEIETGDWDRFGQWFDRTVYCARELARYESPTYKAVAVVVNPGDTKPDPAQMKTIQHQPTDSEERERQANQSYLRLVKG